MRPVSYTHLMFQDKGWLVQDGRENYYVYAQTMNGKTQYGLVVGAVSYTHLVPKSIPIIFPIIIYLYLFVFN